MRPPARIAPPAAIGHTGAAADAVLHAVDSAVAAAVLLPGPPKSQKACIASDELAKIGETGPASA